MNSPETQLNDFQFRTGDLVWATDGLVDEKRDIIYKMLQRISDLGKEGKIDIISEMRGALLSNWEVSYGENLPQWVRRSDLLLVQIISNLEQAGAGKGVDRVRAQVTRSIPQAATWEPNLSQDRREYGMNPGLDAAEFPGGNRGIGVAASPLDITPRDRR